MIFKNFQKIAILYLLYNWKNYFIIFDYIYNFIYIIVKNQISYYKKIK